MVPAPPRIPWAAKVRPTPHKALSPGSQHPTLSSTQGLTTNLIGWGNPRGCRTDKERRRTRRQTGRKTKERRKRRRKKERGKRRPVALLVRLYVMMTEPHQSKGYHCSPAQRSALNHKWNPSHPCGATRYPAATAGTTRRQSSSLHHCTQSLPYQCSAKHNICCTRHCWRGECSAGTLV